MPQQQQQQQHPSYHGSVQAQLPPTSPTAEQWQLEYARMLPVLQQLAAAQQPAWPLRVLRSSQLDAQRLDAELHTMLHEQFMAVFQLLPQGRVASLEPELNLLLAALVFWLSVWQGRATPGSELMNLRYRDERAMEAAAAAAAAAAQAAGGGCEAAQQLPAWVHGGRSGVEGPGLSAGQRAAYGLGCVALPYLWLRLHRLAAGSGGGWAQAPGGGGARAGWRLLRGVDGAHRLAALLNSWVFLHQGKYRSLVERAIGARLVYRQPSMSRLVSFEYLNRQLVWQELSEFLLFLLPLINVAKVRRAVLRLLPKTALLGAGGAGSVGASASSSARAEYPRAPCAAEQAPGPGEGGGTGGGEESGGEESGGEESGERGGAAAAALAVGPVGPCPICGARDILAPYVARPCRHVFCYFCLRSHCCADAGFQCPVDGARVEALQRLRRCVAV